MAAEWQTGTLTDFEGEHVRIDDKPIKAVPGVIKICKVALAKKMKVDYRLNESGEVFEIRQHKDPQPAPASQAAPEKCTSPEKPAVKQPGPALQTIYGAVEAVEVQKRYAKIVDEAGIIHIVKWTREYLDEKMGKLKPGYYRGFSGEMKGEDLIVSALVWVEKTDVPAWVDQRFRGNGGGRGGGAPRNEKIIVLQSCMKVCADVFAITTTPESVDFDKAMDLIVARAIKDMETLCKAGGV